MYCFVLFYFFLSFSSAVKPYGSLSGCRPGRWAGGGNPGWGWRLCGPSPFWWPPPGSGFAWSSGKPAPALRSGSLLRCSGPTLYLDTHKIRCFSLFCLFMTPLLTAFTRSGSQGCRYLRLWGPCGWTQPRGRSWRSCQRWGSRGPRCRGRWCPSPRSTPPRRATCSGRSWGCA